MRLYAFLCYLQLHLFNVEGVDTPRFKIVPRIIKYTTGDTLSFEVSFKDFPRLPSDQYWMSTVYHKKHSGDPSQTGTKVATVPIKHLLKSEKHIYIKYLEVVDDRTDFFVKVENEQEAQYYEENIITLQHQQHRTDETKNECLDKINKCRIIFDRWNPKNNTYTSLYPTGTIEVLAGEEFHVTCRSHNMPQNVKIVMYNNYRLVREVTGEVVKATIKTEKKEAPHTVYCVSHYISYNGSSTEHKRSNTLTIRLKDKPKQSKVTLITEPKLSNVTFYQAGDRFSHNCTAANGKHTTFSWIRQEDNHNFNTSLLSSAIDIVLDESYNNTEIRCVASYLRGLRDPEHFDETFVATKLILLIDASTVPWYIVTTAAAGLALVAAAALAAATRCWRKRKIDHVVEVQNHLYADSDLQYAQLYEQRGARGAPPPPPPHQAPYSDIIGYLHAKSVD